MKNACRPLQISLIALAMRAGGRPRGRDIMAACGQLKSASVKKSAAEKKKVALARQRDLGLKRNLGP